MKICHYNGKANIVGPRIRMERLRQDLTQNELAIRMQLENVDLTQKCISRIETQERFVADFELRAFCKVLKLDIRRLLPPLSDD